VAGVQETYVTMTASQRDALLNSARIAKATAAQAEKRLKGEEQSRIEARKRIEDIEQALRDSDKRAADAVNAMDTQLRSLHDEIHRAEQQQNDRLARQAIEYREALEKQARRTKTEIEKTNLSLRQDLALQREALEKDLAKQRAEFERELQKNHETMANAVNRIKALEEIADKHRILAQYWTEQTNGTIEDISQYRHELFVPGELGRLQNEAVNASRDIEARAYQSAITTGRSAFQNASDLKLRVISAENEWNRVYALWQRAKAAVASDFADSGQLIYEIDTTEGREKVPAALDYWTNGKFRTAQDNLEKLWTEMSNINDLPAETLLCNLRELERLSDELSVLKEIGRENLLRSHNRYVQGCYFADILSANFAMTDCEGDYEGQEQKDAYIGIYKNPVTADVIVVRIQPIPDESGIMSRDKLEIHYLTVSNNEEQRQQWTQTIGGELQKQGVKIELFRGREGYENRPSDQRQMADINWVRQKRISA
jgi:hypothetical protein